MPNQYVNKVALSNGTTLIDLSQDTVTDASHIMSGYVGHLADGTQVTGTGQGGTAAISVVDTLDSHGGTVREITALDISDTTAVASDVAQGKYFYTANGTKTAGTNSGGGGGTPSATAHTIYFEFSDNTNATITVYYDDSFVSSAITATRPSTYSGKTVTLAQLDGVTWYEPINIPIGVELIDYSKLTANTAINSQGQVESTEWYYTSDYTVVDPSMTFEYTASYWHYIGVYDENKNVLRAIYAYQDSTVSSQDSNLGLGTLSGSELTNAKYVRICSSYQSSSGMSLIRTA